MTEDDLTETLMRMARAIESVELGLKIQPSHLLVQGNMINLARRILWPHYILKRRKGARGRAMTLRWRRK